MGNICFKISRNMASNIPSCIINAESKHTATVIFLHGLGDTGHSWCAAFREIAQPYIRYVFPTAHSIPVTLNCGMSMPAWFDITSTEPGAKEDQSGINSAADLLQSYIAAEEALGIPRNRIIIGGFSQGGAMAMYSAFTRPQETLGGLVALSTWMPLHDTFPGALKANQTMPVLQCHGTLDTLISCGVAQLTNQLVKKFNNNVTFKLYNNIGHSSSEDEIYDVKEFITKHLPPI